MSAFAIWRWLPCHALRRPAIAGIWLAFLALAPLGSLLSPLGQIGVDPALALARAWTLPAGVLGAALGVLALSHQAAFLAQLPGRIRWQGEVGALTIATLGMQIPLWLGAAGSAESAGVRPATLAGVALLDLHLVALGALLLRWRAPSSVRSGAFVALVGLVPGLIGGGPLSSRLAVLIDPGRQVEAFRAFDTAPLTALEGPAAIAALLLVSALLAVPPLLPSPTTPR